MPSHTTKIGDAEIVSLSDGHIHFQPSDFFPSIEPGEWETHADQLAPGGLIRMNIGSFAVHAGGKTALIDTGLGEGDHPFDNSEWGLLASDMASKGIGREEIDAVIITHLHRDHVAGTPSARRGRSFRTFPTRATTFQRRTGTPSRAGRA